jgi:hypothetical protein
MADINIRSDSVNVEHIMQQIRARIREKRGVDYTEQQIRDLAAEAFERFLDPQGVRPGLFDRYREGRVPPVENYSFEDTTLFESHRASLWWIRRLLRPILKLFFNPNPLIHVLHLQSGINARHAESTGISYELLYSLVLEMTRLSVEVKALTMRVESTASRIDFAERRARTPDGRAERRGEDASGALPARGRVSQGQAAPKPAPDGPAAVSGSPAAGRDSAQGGNADARRRKRRRRGRRGGASRAAGDAGPGGASAPDETGASETPGGGGEPVAETGGTHGESTGPGEATPTPSPSDRDDQ